MPDIGSFICEIDIKILTKMRKQTLFLLSKTNARVVSVKFWKHGGCHVGVMISVDNSRQILYEAQT